MNGIKAFQQGFLATGGRDVGKYGDWESRQLRYAVYWAYLENNSYNNFLHAWATKYKSDFGLYKHTRNIYNPTYRLCEFYRTHLMGGALDPEAGDGKEVPSALPIVTDNEALRASIAALWLNSNWQTHKSVYSLWGANKGDVGLRVVDDVKRKKVYLRTVDPATVKALSMDEFGNVKGYEIEEVRDDPRPRKADTGTVRYGETATREGDNVVYRTTLDDKPYAWGDEAVEEWSEPYGFVPLVMCQHNNVGLDWGWSEIHPNLSKFREVDDIASKLDDQIRKMVDAAWLFSGMTDPAKNRGAQATVGGAQQSAVNPQPSREELPVFYASDPNAKAMALVAPLDIAATVMQIDALLKELEREYPELQMDIWTAGGDTSGKALRLARQRVSNKVLERRPNYDNALVRAQQMAVAIGGYQGYEGFQGFNLDSYTKGDLDHTIGERPVFQVDKLDKLEEDAAFWSAAKTASGAGVPLPVWLKSQGWTEQQVGDITGSEEYQQKQEMVKNAAMGGFAARKAG